MKTALPDFVEQARSARRLGGGCDSDYTPVSIVLTYTPAFPSGKGIDAPQPQVRRSQTSD